MNIRPVEQHDLLNIAAIHKTQFKTHILGPYSPQLVAEFYRSFLGRSVFLTHETASGVDGFILGGRARELSACKAAFLRDNRLRCIGETMLRPRLWLESLRALTNIAAARSQHAERDESSGESYAEILFWAVADEAKGMGVGVASALYRACELQIKNNATVCVTSVLKTNLQVVRFCQKMGYEIQQKSGAFIMLRKRLRPASTP